MGYQVAQALRTLPIDDSGPWALGGPHAARRLTRRVLALASAPGAAFVAACNPLDRGAPGRGAEKGPVTARVHLRSGVDGTFYKERLTKEFAEQQPRIKVEVEDFPGTSDEYFTKVFALHNTGAVGDVIWSNLAGGRFMSWSYNGIFSRIDDLLRTGRVDTKAFFPTALSVVTFESALYGLPLKAAVGQSLLQYNATLLATAGVAPPDDQWTTDHLVDAARRLTVDSDGDGKPDRWGLGAPEAYNGLVETLRVFGADLLSADGKKCLLNSKEAIDSVQWMVDLRHRSRVAPVVSELPGGANALRTAFYAGSLGFFQADLFAPSVVRAQARGAIEPGVALFPKGPTGKRGSMVGATGVGVSPQSQHKAEAAEILRFLTSPEVGVRQYLEANEQPGARSDVWGDPRVTKDAEFKVFRQAMDTLAPHHFPYNFKADELLVVISERLAPVWKNQASVRNALGDLQTEAQRLLDQPRPSRPGR